MELTEVKPKMVAEYNAYFGVDGKKGERRKTEADTGAVRGISNLALYKYFLGTYKDCEFYKKLNNVLNLKDATARAAGFAGLMNNKRFYFGFLHSDTYRYDLERYCKALDLKRYFADENVIALFDDKKVFQLIKKTAEEAVIIMLMSYFVMNYKGDDKVAKNSAKSVDYKLRQLQDSGLYNAHKDSDINLDLKDANNVKDIEALRDNLITAYKNSRGDNKEAYETIYIKLKSDPYSLTTLFLAGKRFCDEKLGYMGNKPADTFFYMIQSFDAENNTLNSKEKITDAIKWYNGCCQDMKENYPKITFPKTDNRFFSRYFAALNAENEDDSETTDVADAKNQLESQRQAVEEDKKNGNWESSRRNNY